MDHLFEKYNPHYVYHTTPYERAPIVENKATEAMETNVLSSKAKVDLVHRLKNKKFNFWGIRCYN